MIDLWIAIGLTSVIVVVSLFYSFGKYQVNSANIKIEGSMNSDVNPTNQFLLMLIPICFLLISIVLYGSNPSVKLQENWLNTQIETNNIISLKESGLSDKKLNQSKSKNIQNMLLGLRTLAFKDPENAELWFMLAESYFQLSMVDLADESMKRAIRLKPSANWYVAFAQILALRSSESDLSRAIGYLRSAVGIEPTHQSAMLTMGFLYLRQQNYSAAIDIWSYLANQIEKSGGDSSMIRQQISLAKQKQQ